MFKKYSIIIVFIASILTNKSLTIVNLWNTTNYVWNLGIAQHCNKGLNINPVKHFDSEHKFDRTLYNNIQKGDVVFLRCRFVKQFNEQVLPFIQNSFILVICDGDESFPSNCGLPLNLIENFINNEQIIHIFAQNCVYNDLSDKVSHIPIGIDFHTIAYKGSGWGEIGTPKEQEICLNKILAELKPTYLRKKRAFVDFQLADTMHGGFKRYLEFGEDRKSIFNLIIKTGLIDHSPNRMNRSKLWKIKGQYAFSVSPPGNGIDCHRTWEDLTLGCIVIVKTSPLDPIYEGLPVVIVKEWSEITEQNMENWANKYGDAFTNPTYREKLTNYYWLKKIYQKTNK